MAADWAGGIGGALSGAASGSAILPGIGTAVGAGLGLFSGLFGGAEAPEYEPTAVEKGFQKYALNRIKASKAAKKAIRAEFGNLLSGDNRGAAEAFLESQRYLYSNPKFIERKLAKSYKQPIDYDSDSYRSLADTLYKQQGIVSDEDTYGSFADRAKSLNIRSPQAFADMIKQDMIASGKVKTPQQEMLSYMFGEPARDASGRITNLYDRYIPLAERRAAAAASTTA
jgi:hypothetical protein